MIPQDIIDRILRDSDIVEVVGASVQLKRAGRGFKGLCPFHQEKTPSFTVSPERQTFKCFGCGEGGSAIGFLQKMQGCTFPDAVRQLGARLGVEVIDDRADREVEQRRREQKDRLHDVLRRAARFYQRRLVEPGGQTSRDYLERRGFAPATSSRFMLGYAPSGDQLVGAAGEVGVPVEDLIEAGLVSRRRDDSGAVDENAPLRDFFYDRLVFPITDAEGRVIAFGARTLTDRGPKYLNSSDTRLFSKSRVLYGLGVASKAIAKARRAVLMEGYTDVIMAHQAGIDIAVATLGTALTEDHCKLLRRRVDCVDLVYDGDGAGIAAARRGLEVLATAGVAARVVVLPAGLDPCDLLAQEGGKLRFEAHLASGIEPIEFVISRASAAHDVTTVDGKSAAIRDCLSYSSFAPALEQDILLARLADAFEVNVESLRAAMPQQRSPAPSGQRPTASATHGEPPSWSAPLVARTRERRGNGSRILEQPEEGIVHAILVAPALIERIEDRLAPSTLAVTRADLAVILETALDLHHDGFMPTAGVILGRIQEESTATLVARLSEDPLHRPEEHLEACLRRLEDRARLTELDRIDQLIRDTAEGSERDELIQARMGLVREGHEVNSGDSI